MNDLPEVIISEISQLPLSLRPRSRLVQINSNVKLLGFS